MDQYLYIPFLVGWTSIYQLFWCSPGVQGFDTLPYLSSIDHSSSFNPMFPVLSVSHERWTSNVWNTSMLLPSSIPVHPSPLNLKRFQLPIVSRLTKLRCRLWFSCLHWTQLRVPLCSFWQCTLVWRCLKIDAFCSIVLQIDGWTDGRMDGWMDVQTDWKKHTSYAHWHTYIYIYR